MHQALDGPLIVLTGPTVTTPTTVKTVTKPTAVTTGTTATTVTAVTTGTTLTTLTRVAIVSKGTTGTKRDDSGNTHKKDNSIKRTIVTKEPKVKKKRKRETL